MTELERERWLREAYIPALADVQYKIVVDALNADTGGRVEGGLTSIMELIDEQSDDL